MYSCAVEGSYIERKRIFESWDSQAVEARSFDCAEYGSAQEGLSWHLRMFSHTRLARLLPFLRPVFHERYFQTNRTPPYIR
jgi:hypothetical protein